MSTTATEAQDTDEIRAELAETEHLLRTLDPRARSYVGRLLADRDRLVKRLGLLVTTVRELSEELAQECDEADRLTVEVERLRPVLDALAEAVAILGPSSLVMESKLRGWHDLGQYAAAGEVGRAGGLVAIIEVPSPPPSTERGES